MATLSVLYFFDVKEDQEQVFIENWTNLTALIYEYQGSLGSRLHKTEDGRYCGYAMWPNKELLEQDWSNMPHKAKKYRDAMSGACASIKTLETMNVLVDLIREETHKPSLFP